MISCPNCGFDLGSDGRCTVCGYGSEASAPLDDAAASRAPGGRSDSSGSRFARSEERGGRRANLPLLAAAAAALLVLIGVGLFATRHGSPATGGQSVRAQTGPSGTAPTTRTGGAASPERAANPGAKSGGLAPGPSSKGSASRGAAGAASSKISRVGFSAPVGASPVSIRATHPVDLHNPARQPVFDITQRSHFPPLTSEHAYVRWMLAHTHQQEKFLRERWIRAMKAYHRHLVVHRRVLTAFLLTPREWFVRPYNLKDTYENSALPIGYGQTISGPDLVAHMTDALDPQPNQRVLEIGTGSGYQSAVLSQLSNFVYTIEIVRPLAEQTNRIYLEHTKAMPEYANIHRRLADGYYGWPAYAPFDRIIVTTGIDHIPPDLLKQLKPGGIMVIPIGPPTGQTILKITKTVDKEGRVHLKRKDLYPGTTDIFVPFTASGGGTHDTRRGAK